MSRIERALEKAARLRNSPTAAPLSVKEIEARRSEEQVQKQDETHVEKQIEKHAAPPIPDRGVSLAHVDNPMIAILSDPHSPVSEEYRKLKSAVVDFAQQGRFNNVIMVTSSVSCEGKSLTTINLAVTLAQEFDHTVLLIDADLRKPSIHDYLGIKNELGLSDYLAGKAELGSLLIRTALGRLSLLTAGTPQRNPVELFSSQRMKEFVVEIKNRYPDRFIIIDTPPILPFAETRSLTSIADGVIFVVREGHATGENVAEALKSIHKSKLICSVYNDATMASLDGRSHYYYYGYSSGSQSRNKNLALTGNRKVGDGRREGSGNFLKRIFGRKDL